MYLFVNDINQSGDDDRGNSVEEVVKEIVRQSCGENNTSAEQSQSPGTTYSHLEKTASNQRTTQYNYF